MRYLFDQNISHRILKLIPSTYAESTSVKKAGLLNASDREIWEFAKNNRYIIVTQDSDFNYLNSLLGFPPKIIWIRTGNLKTHSIVNILLNNSDEIQKFLHDSNHGCLEIFRQRR